MRTVITKTSVARQRFVSGFRSVTARHLVAILVGTLIVPVGSVALPQLLNQAQAGAITTSGLILNLDANDVNSISGSGATTWKDLSGNGYDATFTGSGSGYTTSYDSTNKAMSFSNGTIRSQNTGASAVISQSIPSQTWSGFSASFSANMGVGGTPSGGINDWSRVFDFSAAGFTQGNGAKGGMFISRFERSDTLWLGFTNMTTTQFGECAAVDIISNEAFAHYAVTVASDGKCIWYKNGTAWRNYRSTGVTNTNTDYGSTGTQQPLPTSDAKTSLRIARSHWNDIYLTGSIRNLAVYNSTLSASQVTTNYNGQTAAYVSDVKPTLASASITGTAQVGTQLSAVLGATTGTITSTTYQWRRADTSGGTYSDIASATSSTYTPVSGDGGKYIQVVVTVSNTGGSATATSAATGQVASTVTLTTPAAPTVSATSNTLKSINVSWSAITNASSYTLRLHNSGGTLIATTGLTGRTGTSATITTSNFASLADSTAYKVSITAIGNGTTYLDSAESNKSDVTTNSPPVSPTISVQPLARTAIVNSTATFSVTATSPDSGSLAYQWQVNTGASWEDLAVGTGFTTNSYTTASLPLTANGYQYRVNVTNSKNGVTSTALTSSAATLTVNAVNQGAAITLSPGVLTFRQAKNLSATVSVAGRVTFRVNGKPIPGCTKKAVAAGGIATCSYRPAIKGSITITAIFDPTDSVYSGVTTSINTVVAGRSGLRGG
jgi:hypothetical protein